jgi:hypothetical protein
MNREQELLQEIQKVIPKGASISAELQKYPGHTKTQRMISLLESLNEERLAGQEVEGYFTGSFESKGHYYWRLVMSKGSTVLGVDNTQLKPPEFGQRIRLTNVEKIHYKVSDRDAFSLTYDAQYTVLPGHVIDASPDLNDAKLGYGLLLANLYRVELVNDGKGGKKPIVDERSFNLKITIRGEDGPERRYASGFVNNMENILSLAPAGDQAEINALIDSDDDTSVIEALSAYCYNSNTDIHGAEILLYANLSSTEGKDKTFWNVGIMKVFNVDNLGVEVHKFVSAPDIEQPIPAKDNTDELEKVLTEIAVKNQDEKTVETEATPPATPDPTATADGEFKHTSVVDAEIKENIMHFLQEEPMKAMDLINKVKEETQASRPEVVDNVNELFTKGYIISKDRLYQVAKEL